MPMISALYFTTLPRTTTGLPLSSADLVMTSATVIAFAVGYAVIAWLLRYVTTHSFLPFVIYRIVLGVLLMVLLSTGALVS